MKKWNNNYTKMISNNQLNNFMIKMFLISTLLGNLGNHWKNNNLLIMKNVNKE
jgi:hypothetical protein